MTALAWVSLMSARSMARRVVVATFTAAASSGCVKPLMTRQSRVALFDRNRDDLLDGPP